MIETTLLIALATNTLWLSPQYKALIKSKMKRRELGWTTNEPEEKARLKEDYPNSIPEWRFPDKMGDTDLSWHDEVESNFFNRKPFACLFCLSFWLAAVFFGVVLFILYSTPGTVGAFSLLKVLASWWAVPFVTVGLNRLFSNLKATI